MFKDKTTVRKEARDRIRHRIRKKIRGTQDRPRVFVHKSNRYIYAQVINDEGKNILASASTQEPQFRSKSKNTKNVDAAKTLGEILAKRLKEKKIKTIVLDRGYFPYHGRIKSMAEALRKEGLIF